MAMDERHAGPPWSVDLLAELHGGALDDRRAATLRALVDSDSEARAVLAALDATQADLANLPPVPMPAAVAARIDAALAAAAAERTPAAPVADLAAARRRRNRRLGWGAGLLAAAAVVVGVAVVVTPGVLPVTGVPQANPSIGTDQPGPSSGPLALRGDQLQSAVPRVLGARDYGPLNTPGKLAECLRANGMDPQATPFGVRQVSVDSRPGIMILLPTGKAMRYHLLVVEPTCSAATPGLIAKSDIGG
ncbi:MAG: hypothetical protein JOZ47_03720 [Kutzneria sp.]|nr:hypothetical protein [Kutzneria sp.]